MSNAVISDFEFFAIFKFALGDVRLRGIIQAVVADKSLTFGDIKSSGDVPALAAHCLVLVTSQGLLDAQLNSDVVFRLLAKSVCNSADWGNRVAWRAIALVPNWLGAFLVGFTEIVFIRNNQCFLLSCATRKRAFACYLIVDNNASIRKHPLVEKVVCPLFPRVILWIMIIYLILIYNGSYIKLFGLVKESGCKGHNN